MNMIEARCCLQKLKDLFPGWAPSDAEADLWLRRFVSHPEEAVMRGIEAHYATTRFNVPKMAGVLDGLRRADHAPTSMTSRPRTIYVPPSPPKTSRWISICRSGAPKRWSSTSKSF